jgi:hypothetical protein
MNFSSKVTKATLTTATGPQQAHGGAAMAIMAISGTSSLGQGSAEPQSSMQQQFNNLQRALSTGNLAGAQQAMTSLQANVQDQLQTNGIRASASDNPQSTLRADMQALQDALDSHDLVEAQQSMIKLIQDMQQIAAAQQEAQLQPGNWPVSAMPNPPNGEDEGEGPGSRGETGNFINVMA